MGNRFLIIINGDSEKRHLKNVEDALHQLDGDFTSIVTNPAKPSACDRYYDNSSVIEKMLPDLRSEVTKEDELVIYVTGHGDKDGICLGNNCGNDVIEALDRLPYKQGCGYDQSGISR